MRGQNRAKDLSPPPPPPTHPNSNLTKGPPTPAPRPYPYTLNLRQCSCYAAAATAAAAAAHCRPPPPNKEPPSSLQQRAAGGGRRRRRRGACVTARGMCPVSITRDAQFLKRLCHDGLDWARPPLGTTPSLRSLRCLPALPCPPMSCPTPPLLPVPLFCLALPCPVLPYTTRPARLLAPSCFCPDRPPQEPPSLRPRPASFPGASQTSFGRSAALGRLLWTVRRKSKHDRRKWQKRGW